MLLRLYAFLLVCCSGGSYLPHLAAQCAIDAHPYPAICLNTNGFIGLMVTGGMPGYAYNFSGSDGSSGNGTSVLDTFNLNNLAAGTYDITVTDNLGCTATTTAVVPSTPSTVVLSTQVINTCASSLISLTAGGGTAPYTFQWSNGSTTQNLVFLSAGTYSATVYDANGCSQTTSETVAAPVALTLQTALTPVFCFGGNTGAIDLTVTGGTPVYTYHWSNNANTEDLSGLVAGTYTVSVSDATGCTKTASAIIIQPTQITLTFLPTQPTCAGSNDGSIDLTVSGGTPPYNYLWNNANFSGQDPTNLAAGSYSVTVTDANGCTKALSIILLQPPLIDLTVNPINVTCNGGNNGAIDLSANGGTGILTYNWANLPGSNNPQDQSGLAAGNYTVTVTDVNGCTKTTAGVVTQPPAIMLQTVVTPVNCLTPNSGTINLTVSGATSPYTYNWSDGFTSQDRFDLTVGTYTVTVTDANGCTALKSVEVHFPTPLTLTADVNYTDCATATISPQIFGGTPPYTYAWSWPFSDPLFPVVLNSGTYTLIITDAGGCTASATYDIELSSNGLCGTIEGHVLRDTNANCQTDAEPGLANWIVRAVGSKTYYGVTDSSGKYQVGVMPGIYTLNAVPPNALWEPCPSLPTVDFNVPLYQPGDTLPAADLLVKAAATCPALSVSIGTAQLRRCMTSYYAVDYCNTGTAPATGAYVLVQLDAYLSAIAATIPYTDLGNGQLRFELGDLPVGACGSFWVYVTLSCSATLGQTHCTEAHIYPDGTCLPLNPQWSGASLQVESQCDGDSLHFTITNVGTGDLIETVDYIVIEDQVMLMQAPVPHLVAGGSLTLGFPANGSTWRMEVQQPAFHPGLSQPSLSVEGCSGNSNFSTGFVSQFPTNDADPWVDIDCTANIGSYDPNDKQGFPTGYGSEHYIRPGTDLEYKIRFQNTGTDTAFNVLVVDTLATWLDPATIQPGPSSHPYRFELYGQGILKFHFENIQLPDSNVNEAASHGFLQFRISPRPSAPLGTLIENQAQIFFDFNDPVTTNTTFHRLAEQFITTGSWQPEVAGAAVVVSPNPFDQQTRLEVKGLTTNKPLLLQVLDLQGNKLLEMNSSTAVFLLKKGDWPTGVYFFRISEQGRLVGSGKLVTE